MPAGNLSSLETNVAPKSNLKALFLTLASVTMLWPRFCAPWPRGLDNAHATDTNILLFLLAHRAQARSSFFTVNAQHVLPSYLLTDEHCYAAVLIGRNTDLPLPSVSNCTLRTGFRIKNKTRIKPKL